MPRQINEIKAEIMNRVCSSEINFVWIAITAMATMKYEIIKKVM